jgi:hypothetical protein
MGRKTKNVKYGNFNSVRGALERGKRVRRKDWSSIIDMSGSMYWITRFNGERRPWEPEDDDLTAYDWYVVEKSQDWADFNDPPDFYGIPPEQDKEWHLC